VSRFVFGSSSSVYGDSTPAPFKEDAVAVVPVSPYAATKRAAELFLTSVAPIYGFRTVSLRFFTVYGPRQRPDLAIHAFTRMMVEGRTLTLFGDGTQARDYTYCDDIVAGVLAAIDWSETAPVGVETFNLGGNRAVPTEAMVAEIAKALGLKPKIEWAPMQPGDVQHTAADLTKSAAVLGYQPKTPFSTGIHQFVQWFREAYGRSD
jgi:UDP-glucuronate 4-epimerase